MINRLSGIFDIKKSDLKFLFIAFLSWRLVLSLIVYLAPSFNGYKPEFLGGGFENFINHPQIWTWVNFDGKHYLSIARNGYLRFTYFYFPVFPYLVRIISKPIGVTFLGFTVVGLVINHLLLLFSLVGIWKLVLLDYSAKIAKKTIILLLLFPTSFYFAAFYTESIFLFLAVWSFYFARTKRWKTAFALAGISCATRIVGLGLVAGLVVEYVVANKTLLSKISPKSWSKLISYIVFGMSGILVYTYFVYTRTGDPLEILNSVSIFGAQRSTSLIFPPRVYFRYMFKILPSINYGYLPVVFTTFLEFFTAILFGVILTLSFLSNINFFKNNTFKMRWSYFIFSLILTTIPMFSGSFSSLPRYVVVIFPLLILFAKLHLKQKKNNSIVIVALLICLLTVSLMLYSVGIWVS